MSTYSVTGAFTDLSSIELNNVLIFITTPGDAYKIHPDEITVFVTLKAIIVQIGFKYDIICVAEHFFYGDGA